MDFGPMRAVVAAWIVIFILIGALGGLLVGWILFRMFPSTLLGL